MYVYCFYSSMTKMFKQLSNSLKRAETIVTLIVFNGIPYYMSAYTVSDRQATRISFY